MTTYLQQLAYQYESEKAATKSGDLTMMDLNSNSLNLQNQMMQPGQQEREDSFKSNASRERDIAAQQRENKLQLQQHERDQHLHQLKSISNYLIDLPASGSNSNSYSGSKFSPDGISPTKGASASLEDMSICDLFGLAMPRGSLMGAGQNEQGGGQAGFETSANRNYYQQRDNSSGYYSNTANEHDNMNSFYSMSNNTDVPSSPSTIHTPLSPSTPGSVYSSHYSSVGSSSPYTSDSAGSNTYNKRFPSSPGRSPCYGRPIRGSPSYSDCSSPSAEYPPHTFGCNGSRSDSPADSEISGNSVEGPLSDIMSCLSMQSPSNRCYPPYPNIFLEAEKLLQNNGASLDNPKMKKLLYNPHHLHQQQQQPPSPQTSTPYNHHHHHGRAHSRNHGNQQHNGSYSNPAFGNNKVCCLVNPRNLTVNTLSNIGGTNHLPLDKAAKFHRNAAAASDATYTWSGTLPTRTQKPVGYSSKVFLGGVPWDITDSILIHTFRQFGQIRIEWPGKDQETNQPKGYVYIVFESEKQVKALLASCTHDFSNGGSYYYKISSRRMKGKQVQVIPWALNDSNYVKSSSQKLDAEKTVFVGALHGMMTAVGLATIMNDLFDNVIYAGIDTDKHKYPIGSARVTFSSKHSFHKAINAAFIEVKTAKFTKKVQVDPYIEDAPCSICFVQQGPYFCRESVCFKYFCHTCWHLVHRSTSFSWHKPMSRVLKCKAICAPPGQGPNLRSSLKPLNPYLVSY